MNLCLINHFGKVFHCEERCKCLCFLAPKPLLSSLKPNYYLFLSTLISPSFSCVQIVSTLFLTIMTIKNIKCSPLYPCHYWFLQSTILRTTRCVSCKWFYISFCFGNTLSELLLWEWVSTSFMISLSILLKAVKNLSDSKYIIQICESIYKLTACVANTKAVRLICIA